MPKQDNSKLLVRSLRDVILNAFDDHPSSFIDKVPIDEIKTRMNLVIADFDYLPTHYLLHLIHASEIIGYKHPNTEIKELWGWFYLRIVHKMHLNVETEVQMNHRLLADENTFKKMNEKD